jgi:hypothetical protein
MRGVEAEPQRHGNHAIASGEILTFRSDAFSGSFLSNRKLSTVIGTTSTINRQGRTYFPRSPFVVNETEHQRLHPLSATRPASELFHLSVLVVRGPQN